MNIPQQIIKRILIFQNKYYKIRKYLKFNQNFIKEFIINFYIKLQSVRLEVEQIEFINIMHMMHNGIEIDF